LGKAKRRTSDSYRTEASNQDEGDMILNKRTGEHSNLSLQRQRNNQTDEQ